MNLCKYETKFAHIKRIINVNCTYSGIMQALQELLYFEQHYLNALLNVSAERALCHSLRPEKC